MSAEREREEARVLAALKRIAYPRPVAKPFMFPRVRLIETPTGTFYATGVIEGPDNGLAVVGYSDHEQFKFHMVRPGEALWLAIKGDECKRCLEWFRS